MTGTKKENLLISRSSPVLAVFWVVYTLKLVWILQGERFCVEMKGDDDGA